MKFDENNFKIDCFNCETFDFGSLKKRFKLSGQLPLLSIQISDQKVTSILELIDSIPKPESAPATSSPKMTEVRFLKEISLKIIRKIPS